MEILPIKRLACVFAHPDDEAFGPGGAIATFAKDGAEIHLICVTDGDGVDPDTGKASQTLAAVRKKELQESAEILGIQSVTFLGFHDGTLNNNLYHTVAAAVRKKLDAIRPDTVLTFDTNGVSGHIDHITVSLVCSYLFSRLPYTKQLLYYCEDREVAGLLKDYFIYFPPGYTRSEVDAVVDTSAVFDTKVRAMLAHVSQKEDADMILAKLKDHLRADYFRILRK